MYYNGTSFVSSTSSSTTSRSNSISGLASGLNTEELVKNMTLGIRTKIAKQQQSATRISWRIDAYRSISSKLIEFSNKYLSYASSTNALSSSFFRSATVTAKGVNAGAVSVSGNSDSVSSLSILDIKSTAATAGFLSSTPAASNKISTGTIDFSAEGKLVNNLAGETINLEFGTTAYNITIDKSFSGTTAAEAAAAFNAALAQIELSDGTLADRFVMTTDANELSLASLDPGSSATLRIIGGSGTSLAALGISAGSSASGPTAITGTFDPSQITSNLNFFETAANKTISLSYNGVSKSVTLPDMSVTQDKGEFISAFQSAVDNAFGANRIRVAFESDSLTFETVRLQDGSLVSDSTATLSIIRGDRGLFGDKGVLNAEAGLSNRLVLGYSLNENNFASALTAGVGDKFEISVNGETFEFGADQTLTSILDTINNSDAGVKIQYLSTTNRFSVIATQSGASGRVEISDLSGNLAQTLFGTEGTDEGQYKITQGADAEIEISYDGGLTSMSVVRSSNNFDIDGLSISLNPGVAFESGIPITFDSKSNTEDIIKNIKSMIEDYNSIIELSNTELSTARDRNYSPLTSEQRKDMSESEIKLWEEKAKAGLLMNDPTVRSLTSDLRFAFTVKLAAYGGSNEIGISSSTSYKDNGKLVVDEEKLRKALTERPEEISRLFTDPSDGIMKTVKDTVDKYAATTGVKGSLITLAGVKDSITASESALAKQIVSIEKTIANLMNTQEAQEDRYYKQFTTLEKYIAQMNAQSSWLYQQTGG